MSFLKIGGKQQQITHSDNLMNFFNSMCSSSFSPKSFNIMTDGNNENGTDKYELNIETVGREDGSGTSFYFTATGYALDGEKKIPEAEKIDGYIKF